MGSRVYWLLCLILSLGSSWCFDFEKSSPLSVEILSFNVVACKSNCSTPDCAPHMKMLNTTTSDMVGTIGRFAIFTKPGFMLALCYSNDVRKRLAHHQWKTRVFKASRSENQMLQIECLTTKNRKESTILNPMINVAYNAKQSEVSINCSITYQVDEDHMLILVRILSDGKRKLVVTDPKQLIGSIVDQTVRLSYTHRFLYTSENLHEKYTCLAFDHNLKTHKSVSTQSLTFERKISENLIIKWERQQSLTLPKKFTVLDSTFALVNTTLSCEENIGVPKPDLYWIDNNWKITKSSRIRINKTGPNYLCCFANQTLTGKTIIRKKCVGAKIGYKDCSEIRRLDPAATSGIYTIHLNDKPLKVYCDMKKDGEAWIVIQKRFCGQLKFDKAWNEYKSGFGELWDEFWLGNDIIHQLTKRAPMKIRFDLYEKTFKYAYIEYNRFSVDNEASQYNLTIGSYSGNGTNCMMSMNGMKFSTMDRDNDLSSSKCSRSYGFAGWWFNDCGGYSMNGDYRQSSYYGVYTQCWSGKYLKRVEMKIKYI